MKLAKNIPFSIALVAALGVSFFVTLRAGRDRAAKPVAITGSPMRIPAVQTIAFTDDFGAALDRAAKENKPVMLYASSETCGYCRQLEAEVFTDARIVERSQGYIAVKIDGGNYPALMEKLGVGGYPYLGFFNPKGQVTREIRGYMPLESFLGEMPYAPPSDDITAPGETVKRSTM